MSTILYRILKTYGIKDDTELTKVWKFLKRSVAAFLTSHAIQYSVDNEKLDARILDNEIGNDARLRKKKKWQVILPLAILGKLMHLKMMVFHVLVGIGVVQVILLGGGAFLFYYLKHNSFNSLVYAEPHLIHSHSHVLESAGPGPELPYSGTYSSSYPYTNGPSPYGPGPSGYKGWASDRSASFGQPSTK